MVVLVLLAQPGAPSEPAATPGDHPLPPREALVLGSAASLAAVCLRQSRRQQQHSGTPTPTASRPRCIMPDLAGRTELPHASSLPPMASPPDGKQAESSPTPGFMPHRAHSGPPLRLLAMSATSVSPAVSSRS